MEFTIHAPLVPFILFVIGFVFLSKSRVFAIGGPSPNPPACILYCFFSDLLISTLLKIHG